MARGQNLTNEHQRKAAMAPRPRKPTQASAARNRKPKETMEEASLRLQPLVRTLEELDKEKRQLEIDQKRGLLILKEEAVDLAQAAIMEACKVFDLFPEQVRDRLPEELLSYGDTICDIIENEVRIARTEVGSLG